MEEEEKKESASAPEIEDAAQAVPVLTERAAITQPPKAGKARRGKRSASLRRA